MAEAFANVTGRRVAYAQTPTEQLRAFSDDIALIFEWFNAHGYEADIAALRNLNPGLNGFGTWLGETGWRSAQEPANVSAAAS